MRVQQISIFKTPLNPDYKDVYDSVSSTRFHSFLMTTFPKKTVTTGGVKTLSIVATEESTTVVLPYRYEDVRDYNYCSILPTFSTTPRFYFIVGGNSLNDSDSPSCRLNLVWDAWANNLDALNNQSNSDVNYIKRRHFDMLINKDGVKYVNGFNHKVDVQIHKELQPFTRILWACVSFAGDVRNCGITYPHISAIPRVASISSANRLIPIPTFYIPLLLLKSKDNELTLTEIVTDSDNRIGNVRLSNYIYGTSIDTINNFQKLDGNYVKFTKLTYNPPFEYTLTTEEFEYEGYTRERYVISSHTDIVGINPNFQTVDLPQDPTPIVGHIYGFSGHENFKEVTTIDKENINNFLIPSKDSSGIANIIYAQLHLYEYPYNYHSFKIGGVELSHI